MRFSARSCFSKGAVPRDPGPCGYTKIITKMNGVLEGNYRPNFASLYIKGSVYSLPLMNLLNWVYTVMKCRGSGSGVFTWFRVQGLGFRRNCC